MKTTKRVGKRQTSPKVAEQDHPLLASARELYARAEKEGSKAVEVETERLYREVYGEPLQPCNCKDRIADALILIITHLRKNRVTMAERKYILKRGVVIHHNGGTYTRVNITDAVAEEWSKLYPTANVWEVKPEPTEEEAKEVEQKPVEVINDAPEPTEEEAKEVEQ